MIQEKNKNWQDTVPSRPTHLFIRIRQTKKVNKKDLELYAKDRGCDYDRGNDSGDYGCSRDSS